MSVFFFKQKTAYEMRISDWSSDVCSSDLVGALADPKHTCSESGTFRADSLTDRADTDDEHHARTQQARHPRPPTACLLIPKSFRQPPGERQHHSENGFRHRLRVNSCTTGQENVRWQRSVAINSVHSRHQGRSLSQPRPPPQERKSDV